MNKFKNYMMLLVLFMFSSFAYAETSSQIPTKIQVPWAANAGGSYKRTVPVPSQIGIQNGAASWNDGFPPLNFIPTGAGGVPPYGQDMNGVLNAISALTWWYSAGGPISYDATFQTAIGGYPKGAIVQSTATVGLLWVSSTENNVTNPDTGGAGWINLSIPSATTATTATSLVQGTHGYTLLPEVATTSGTSVDILGGASIPAWATKIYVMLNGVETNGTSVGIIQIGPSAGVEITGYLGEIGSGALITNGMGVTLPTAVSEVWHGRAMLTLEKASANQWSFTSIAMRTDVAAVSNAYSGGTKPLAGALAKMKITTVNGTDAFIGGAVAVAYE